MRHVLTGEELKTDPNTIRRRARDVYVRNAGGADAPQITDAELTDLLLMIGQDDLADFREKLPAGAQGHWQALWTALATAVNSSESTTTAFNLPYPPDPVDVEHQTVVVHDNCKDTATATVFGFPTLASSRYLADLRFGDEGHRIAATAVAQATGGSPMTLTFPSLNELARDDPDIKSACTAAGGSSAARQLENAVLVVRRQPDTKWESPEARTPDECTQSRCAFRFRDVIFDSSLQLAQTVGLTAGADTIVADAKGIGTIRLFVRIDKDLDGAAATFSGGVPSSMPALTTAAVNPLGSGFTIVPTPSTSTTTASATPAGAPLIVDVPLQALVAGRELTVTVTGQKSSKAVSGSIASLSIPIVAPSGSPKSTPATP
jgi:hypothetical protein